MAAGMMFEGRDAFAGRDRHCRSAPCLALPLASRAPPPPHHHPPTDLDALKHQVVLPAAPQAVAVVNLCTVR